MYVTRCRSRRTLLSLAVPIAVALPLAAGAATFYDFTWSGNSFSAAGTLELDDSVGVGAPFTIADVLAFELELRDGGVPVASLAFPPFDLGFHTIEGTREASSLSIDDLIVSDFAILFGCEGSDCLSSVVYFDTPATPGATVDFGSIAAARASFVFTEVPEPGAAGALAASGATLAALRAVRSRRPRAQ